jgi:hypothetical protein
MKKVINQYSEFINGEVIPSIKLYAFWVDQKMILTAYISWSEALDLKKRYSNHETKIQLVYDSERSVDLR